MNTGIITSRYARALLVFAMENNAEDNVRSQIILLDKTLSADPKLIEIICGASGLKSSERLSILRSLLGDVEMDDVLKRFLVLVFKNGRAMALRMIFRSFLTEYDHAKGIRDANLVMSSPIPGFEDKLKDFVRKNLGLELRLVTKINPSLIGGFIFEMDGHSVDASVSRQLDILRRQFAENNRRIV